MRFSRQVILIALIIFIVVTVTAAHAQTNAGLDIRISSVSTQETSDSMLLKVYFNIYDPRTSIPVVDKVAKSAMITLPEFNYTVSPQIQKPDVPIYVVLILDSSGSMAGAAETLKKAANLALDDVPDNSYFSVVQFDETITRLQDFTQNIYAVRDAINRQYVVSQKGTCLYDAGYSAIEALEKTTTAGRRAIILFTDGKDETQTGKPCSKHSSKDLTELARKDTVPISSIGLSYKEGNLDEVELKNMADSTGGFSAIAKNTDMMYVAFKNIMDVLKSQWMVEANIYPKRGANQATLTINFDDQTLTKPIEGIVSNADYVVPSKATVYNAKLELSANKQSYDFHWDLNHPEEVEHLFVSLQDTKANLNVKDYPFSQADLSTNNTFPISSDLLVSGRDYALIVTATDKDGAQIPIGIDQNGKPTKEFVFSFTFDPSSAYPNLTIQSITEDNKHDLVLGLTATHSDMINGFEVWLEDETTGGITVPDSTFNLSSTEFVDNSLRVPLHMRNISDGAKYTIVIRALGQNGKAYSGVDGARREFSYIAPNIFERLAAGLVTYWYISLIIFIILGLMVWFVITNTKRADGASATPVMQGLLGKKKVATGPVPGISDEEPLPIRQQMTQQKQAPVARVSHTPSTEEWSAAGPTIIQDDTPAESVDKTSGNRIAQVMVIQSSGSAPEGPISIDQIPFVIGRIEANLTIKDKNLSRRHAEIIYDNVQQNYFLTDLGSSNGTYLNGQRLIANQPMQLVSGATIKLGTNTIVRFDLS